MFKFILIDRNIDISEFHGKKIPFNLISSRIMRTCIKYNQIEMVKILLSLKYNFHNGFAFLLLCLTYKREEIYNLLKDYGIHYLLGGLITEPYFA